MKWFLLKKQQGEKQAEGLGWEEKDQKKTHNICEYFTYT